MAESQSQAVSTHARASPWPVFVALGFVLSEVGVLFGVRAVSVGGVLLLSASVVGILRESAYTATLSRPTLAVGVLFGAIGGALYGLTAYFRGVSLLLAGGVLVLAAAVLYGVETGRI